MRETLIILSAMASITSLSIVSVLNGIYGVVLCSAFTTIGGLGGYSAVERIQGHITPFFLNRKPLNK